MFEREVSMIKTLFFQRMDDFPIQLEDGSYIRAGRPLTDNDIIEHLLGNITIGAYNLDTQNMCRWICWDFDGEHHEEEARELYEYLISKPPYRNACALEDTGGRGSHVWLFFTPMEAEIAYMLGRKILAKVETEKCEVFPKQMSIPPDGYGNLVKVPLGIHRKTGRRSQLVMPDSLEKIQQTTLTDEIKTVLKKTWEREDTVTFSPLPFVGCQAMTIINRGVREGERNESAFFKARVMWYAGLSREEAKSALETWNLKNSPPLSERELENVLKSVYTKRYRVSLFSLRKNKILGKYCEGCVNPVCEKRTEVQKKRKRNRGVEVVYLV